MIFIAHRGNINGNYPDKENRADYIHDALNQGFDVEIDVWFTDNQWWLGHDEPKYKTGTSIFRHRKVWTHAKNPEALNRLRDFNCHYFWHDGDDYAITSKGYIWCHKDAIVLPQSICVLPESQGFEAGIDPKCIGVCSDTVGYYKTHA